MTEHERGDRAQTGVAGVTLAEYEYNTLMRLLGVSVSKHLLDEHFTLIWANEFYYELIGWPKDEYEAVFHGGKTGTTSGCSSPPGLPRNTSTDIRWPIPRSTMWTTW